MKLEKWMFSLDASVDNQSFSFIRKKIILDDLRLF